LQLKITNDMKNSIMIFACLAAVVLLNGCASTGLTASSHVTNVQLTNPNFKIVATNVSGEATSKAVLGVSYGLGVATSQLALIPLQDDRMLYKRAIEKLWANFEAKNGAVANRRLALVNVRYDSESLNLFLYTEVTTAIVADVVEFE
jgi:hypothetical protein